MVGNEMVEEGEVQLLCGLAVHGKKFGFYAVCSAPILVGFPLFFSST